MDRLNRFPLFGLQPQESHEHHRISLKHLEPLECLKASQFVVRLFQVDLCISLSRFLGIATKHAHGCDKSQLLLQHVAVPDLSRALAVRVEPTNLRLLFNCISGSLSYFLATRGTQSKMAAKRTLGPETATEYKVTGSIFLRVSSAHEISAGPRNISWRNISWKHFGQALAVSQCTNVQTCVRKGTPIDHTLPWQQSIETYIILKILLKTHLAEKPTIKKERRQKGVL